MEYKCKFCEYKTNRNYNLLRHQNAKHKCKNIENTSENLTGQNVPSNGENVIPNGENVIPNSENVIPNQNICKKCNKIYNSKRYLI